MIPHYRRHQPDTNYALNIIGLVLFVTSLFFNDFFVPQILIWHLVFWQVAVLFYGLVALASSVMCFTFVEWLKDRFPSMR